MSDVAAYLDRVERVHGFGLIRRCALRTPGAEILAEAIRAGGHRRVLEIGTYRGVTAGYLAGLCERVITIDVAGGRLEQTDDGFDRGAFWAGLGIGNVELVVAESEGARRRAIAKARYDLAFVDGDHEAPAPALDFALVRHCGAVILHDAAADNGVRDLLAMLPAREVRIAGDFALWRRAH